MKLEHSLDAKEHSFQLLEFNLLSSTLQTLMLSRYFYIMYLISVWVKTALISAIYRKSLNVSSSGKKDTTTGEVVNLMSVDTQRVVDSIVSLLRQFFRDLIGY